MISRLLLQRLVFAVSPRIHMDVQKCLKISQTNLLERWFVQILPMLVLRYYVGELLTFHYWLAIMLALCTERGIVYIVYIVTFLYYVFVAE